MDRATPTRFGKFFCVGIAGFLVDAGVLKLMTEGLGLDPYTGRLISFLCAATTTYFGNRFFTFSDRKGHAGKQWAAFLLVSAGGFVLNYGTYVLLVSYVDLVRQYLVLGVAAGSIAGMFFNFSGASRLVFRELEKPPVRAI
jgi:putative flippase GtrA